MSSDSVRDPFILQCGSIFYIFWTELFMFRWKFWFRPLGEAQGPVKERHVLNLSVHKRAFHILFHEIPYLHVLYVVKMNLTTFKYRYKIELLLKTFGNNPEIIFRIWIRQVQFRSVSITPVTQEYEVIKKFRTAHGITVKGLNFNA